jgi:hypothetical protein
VSVPVKVIEGVDVAGVVGSGMNDAGIDPTQAHPETMHGPEALFPLSGLCFCESADRMEYCVCPFRNVTMRRVTGGRATVLGVFGSWVGHRSSSSSPLGNDNLVMEFFRGQACGQGTRRVSVEIVPDAAEYVLDAASIEENPACHTQMRLLVPLPRDLLTDPSRFLARRWDSSPAPPSSVEAASSGGEVGAVGTTPQTGHTHTHMQASSGLAPIEPPVAPSSPLVPADRDKLVALEVKVCVA